jgi:hypothetical protein|tara:strand:- start:426 stop:860 length:435 start_codon:yes stop_codon:yes gene_type:complete
MSSGVLYHYEAGDRRVYFHNPVASLPIIAKSGDIIHLPWGRRQKQVGALPLGGWARLEGIYKGQWDRWQPMPVKIPASAFMEKSHDGGNHWFDLVKGQCLQGLVARDQYEQRVYIVTIEPEQENAWYYRWPRVIHKNYDEKGAL